MKKKSVIVITIIVVFAGAFLLGTGFQDKSGGVKPHYLTFYNTFGGFNSSFGAKDHFVLELNPDDTEIYFNRPNNGYELVLQKDSDTGEWMRPTE